MFEYWNKDIHIDIPKKNNTLIKNKKEEFQGENL